MLYPEKLKIRKILITGSSGFIGRLISPYLMGNGFFIRGFDNKNGSLVDEFILGELEDLYVLKNTVKNVDAIIHLAAFPDEGDFIKDLLIPNIIGIYNLFEAIQNNHIIKVILASSVQVVDINYLKGKICTDVRKPTNYYGLTKVWAEEVGCMNARLYQIPVIAARIGWVVRNKKELKKINQNLILLKLYISHNDIKQFFLKCLLASVKDFCVINAVSRYIGNDGFDIEDARKLIDYQPVDLFPYGSNFKMLE